MRFKLNRTLGVLGLLFGPWLPGVAGQGEWQRITMPDASQAYAHFQNPPPEYGLTMWWWWNGPMSEADIVRDLRDMHEHNICAVMIWAAPGLEIAYLSPEWFDRVRFAVDQARQLNMRVWLMDEGGYPSGFAGGKVTREYPHLGMRMLFASERSTLKKGERFSAALPPGFLAASAMNRATRQVVGWRGHAGKTLEWVAPQGTWEVVVVSEKLSTSPTRHVHSPGARKDTTNALIDLLNPVAADRFLQDVHGQYEKHIGKEFGRTVLGFMSDEPNYSGLAWTPSLPAEFQKRKGYDLVARLPEMLNPSFGDEATRIMADYHEVWTAMLAEGFFGAQAEWCARRNLEYMTHLWGEGEMKTLIPHDGDYFAISARVQIPGVDAVWREIWPGRQPYFPKLASSAAHLYGRPRAFTESYAVYGAGLSIEQAKWVMDYQFVRGINLFQAMSYLSSNSEYRPYLAPPSWSASPQWSYFSELATYANRLSCLLSSGRPTAATAILYPIANGWLGSFEAERSMAETATQMLERQRDFDFIPERDIQLLSWTQNSRVSNRSGQSYHTFIIPSGAVLSSATLDRLNQFAQRGIRVVCLGKPPVRMSDRSFLLSSTGSAPIPGFLLEPSGQLENDVLAALPEPDLELHPATRDVKCLHRSLADAEVFFLFNEGQQQVETLARLRARGTPEFWDPLTGERTFPFWSSEENSEYLQMPLLFEPLESKLIVVRRRPDSRPSTPVRGDRITNSVELSGDWTVALEGEPFHSVLKNWSEWNRPEFWGTARYRKEFDWDGHDADFLDLGEVRYAARARLNGVDLGRRGWRPYRWNIGGVLKNGRNVLEIEVANTRANEVAANPSKLRELERRGWSQMSMIGRYIQFDSEMVSSGLIGPVRILTR
jgi:hypothetical protein